MKYDIFISYRRVGGFEMAKLLSDALRRKGYRVFMDVEGLKGGKFNEQLYTVMDNCNNVLLICSKDCFARCNDEEDWVRKEIAHALNNKKVIIPVVMDGFTFPSKDKLPEDIRGILEYEAFTPSREMFQESVNRLCKRYITGGAYYGRMVTGAAIACAVVCVAGALIYMNINKSDYSKPVNESSQNAITSGNTVEIKESEAVSLADGTSDGANNSDSVEGTTTAEIKPLVDPIKVTIEPVRLESKDAYRSRIKEVTGQEIIFSEYLDCNGDGNYEMFALVGDRNNYQADFDYYEGDVWYIDRGEENCILTDFRMRNMDVVRMGKDKIVTMEEIFTTGSLTHLWSVNNNKPYELEISQTGGSLVINNENDIIMIVSDYDFMWMRTFENYHWTDKLMGGHTWKPYYFFYEDGEIMEYGGLSITKEQFLKLKGASDILDMIQGDGYHIEDIYYHENNRIMINVRSYKIDGDKILDSYNDEYIEKECEIQAYFLVYNIVDGTLKELNSSEKENYMYYGDSPYLEGIYNKNVASSVVSYPKTFPY